MATNEDKARDYAAQHGITITPETMGHDGPAVEVWSYDARMSEPNSYAHTFFARGNTWPQAWADALAYMQGMEECPADCDCRRACSCAWHGNSGQEYIPEPGNTVIHSCAVCGSTIECKTEDVNTYLCMSLTCCPVTIPDMDSAVDVKCPHCSGWHQGEINGEWIESFCPGEYEYSGEGDINIPRSIANYEIKEN